MNSSQYISDATRTESKDFEAISQRLSQTEIIRLLHGAMGLETETGELMDALKKHIFYGAPLDRVNVIEEVGDLFWYLAIICSECRVDFEAVMHVNIQKLKARYGDKFSEGAALKRDLNTERAVLEGTK